MAQAATAQDLSPQPLAEQEIRPEAKTTPEKGELGKALESGSKETVVGIFKKDSAAAKEAIQRLDVSPDDLNPEFMTSEPVAQDLVGKVKAAGEQSAKKVEEAEALALKSVEMATGAPVANEAPAAMPAPAAVVEAPSPAVVEAPVPAPIMAKSEAPAVMVAPTIKVESAPVMVRNEAAEQQKNEAEASMKEDEEALRAFASEHGLELGADLGISQAQLKNLTPTERTYVAVLQAKYRAGEASAAHAEALMAVAAEADDVKKKALSKKAFDLSEQAKVAEVAATALNAEYMALPEIAALTNPSPVHGPGNETGGSFQGGNFETPPGAGSPSGPSGPEGPKGPDLTIIRGGGGEKSKTGGGSPLYTDQVYGGPPGLVKVEPVKVEAYHAKDQPEHINFFRRWVIDNANQLKGFFGMSGGGGGGGKPKGGGGGGGHH